MSLDIKIDEYNDQAKRVNLNGHLDSNTAHLLDEALENEVLPTTPNIVIYDLKKLDYISSAGLRILFKNQKKIEKFDGEIVFINMQPQIKKVFDIVHAIADMQLFYNYDEMDEYLDEMQKKVLSGDI